MSRLILEGDTTERFGVKYPKPYIEKIEVFDSNIVAHVYVYLQVEEEVNDVFQLESLISNLNIVYIFGNKSAIDVLTADDFEFVYSSNGVKYAKIKIAGPALGTGMATYDIGYDQISQITEPIYFGAFTYARGQTTLHKAPEPTTFDKSGVYKQYEAIASQLSYELIVNSDGTPADEVIAYLQTDGNYFGSVPLQSLDRVYRTNENISHRQVISTVDTIIGPFIGNIAEADNISVTLQQYSDNPTLLLELKKQINSFSNKSSATVTGQLYDDLVDAVSQLNAALEQSGRLQKRLVRNSKIIDQRTTVDAPYADEGFYDDGAGSMPAYAGYVSSATRDPNFLFVKPSTGPALMSRRIVPSVSLVGATEEEIGNIDNYVIINDTYVFFDYDKALSYTSQLSRHLNIYNIQELFGKNCLNKYFSLTTEPADSVTVEKFFYNVVGEKRKTRQLGFNGSFEIFDNEPQFEPTTINKVFQDYEYISKRVYDGASTDERYQSKVVPRAVYIGDENYRLMCFYITDIEQLRSGMKFTYYDFKIRFDDQTMKFYNDIRRELARVKLRLTQYQQFAQEFCSFNNLNGKFNDFFIEDMNSRFNTPYPWEEAPLYLASLEALLVASYGSTEVPFTIGNRQDTRASLDLEFIKQIATVQSRHIAPETGDLEQLNDFVDNKFSQLVEHFGRGSGLDFNGQIYLTDPELTNADALRRPSAAAQFESPPFELPRNLINSYYEEYEAPVEDEIEEAASGRIRRWSGNQYDWNEEKTRRFVESRIIALMGTRGLKNDNPNDYTDNTIQNLKNAMSENDVNPSDQFKENGSSGVTAGGGGGRRGNNRKSRRFANRASRIFLYIEELTKRLDNVSNIEGNRRHNQRKNLIEQKMNYLKNRTSSGEEIIPGWKRADKNYVDDQYPIFGNIGLYLIKCRKVLGRSVVADVVAGIRNELRQVLREED